MFGLGCFSLVTRILRFVLFELFLGCSALGLLIESHMISNTNFPKIRNFTRNSLKISLDHLSGDSESTKSVQNCENSSQGIVKCENNWVSEGGQYAICGVLEHLWQSGPVNRPIKGSDLSGPGSGPTTHVDVLA